MKNYTSTVDPLKSVALMEVQLVKAGATNISKEYEGGKVVSLSFTIKHPDSQFPLAIRLPANVPAVYQVLRGKVSRMARGTQNRLQDQAERTAWKLLHDWLCVQLSLIEMRQVELLQVFLPFVWDGKQSYFHFLKEQGFKALSDTDRPRLPPKAED